MATTKKEEHATKTKDDVLKALRESQKNIEEVASSLPEPAWATGVYENGWNAKQLLCHLTESCGVAAYLVGMAQAPAGSGGMPAAFDIDAWNGQRIAALQDRSISDLMAELRTNTERNIAAVQGASDELLSKSIKPPWDWPEGALADVITQSNQAHVAMHLADLRRSAAG